MFSKLKRLILALTVTAGLLAITGPASAATTHEPRLKFDSNDALRAAILAADFSYHEAKGFRASQPVPTSVEAIDAWETLHGDFATF